MTPDELEAVIEAAKTVERYSHPDYQPLSRENWETWHSAAQELEDVRREVAGEKPWRPTARFVAGPWHGRKKRFEGDLPEELRVPVMESDLSRVAADLNPSRLPQTALYRLIGEEYLFSP